jgi:hypothetical protein
MNLQLSLGVMSLALGRAIERRRAPGQLSALLSCTLYSGTCGGCDYNGAPCGGYPSCYPNYNCQGVHLDTCPSGFTSIARWWCCCSGELISCTDCKAGTIFCICQGINYQSSC